MSNGRCSNPKSPRTCSLRLTPRAIVAKPLQKQRGTHEPGELLELVALANKHTRIPRRKRGKIRRYLAESREL